MLHGKKAAFEVNGKNLIPLRLCDFNHASSTNNAHVVVQNMNFTKSIQRFFMDFCNVVLLADISLQAHGSSACFTNDSGGFLGGLKILINTDVVRTFPCI